uniref:Macro domain-containing protein n=1 Tax=Biomphalaria glabrata TaxID=6526 RepID=A0A2C9M131_BIOGL
MEQLMLIIGFEQEIKISKLKELAKNYFEGNELLMIWRDPYSEPRAVLMFQEPLDIESSRKSHYKALKDENYFVCVEKPTSCIFIRTYKASKYGLIDKLILLFMKTLHTSVIDKVQLEDSCFKIEFKDGWDAVLKACNRNWKINETELTVLPFFESFQESFDDQWPRLELEINKLNETLFSHDDLETPVNYTEMVEAVSGEHDTSSVDNTLIIFTNELMPEIIDKLNIKDALKSHKYEFMIHNDEKVEISGEISGAKNKLRSIQQVIYEEDQQVTNLLKSTNAVINTEILKTNKYFIVFSEDSGKFTMDVTGENCEKIPFHHFVSSIMFSKTFDGKEGDLPQQSVPSQVKVQPSYQFEHCFTFGILKALKFDHLLKRKYPGIIVDFDVTEKTKVFISRPVMETKELFSIIKQEEEKINLNKEETLFLSQKIIMDEIEKQNHIIEFCESSKILQVRGPQPTARFSDYVNSLIITKKINCGEIDPKAFTTYRDSFNKEHSFGQITFLKGKVIFLCLSFNLSAIEIFVQLIKDSVEPLKIKSLTDDYTQSKDITVQPEKTDNFTNATYTYEKMDTSSNEKNREYILETWQYEYCTMFIHELKKGKDVTDIKLLPNKLIVSFKPFTSDYSITSFQKYLDSIQHQETILEYQGLSQFAKLNEGREIISEISKSTQCCILVPDKLLKETEAIETENYDYKTILLFTADCDRFKIHLVQGHIEDIKTQMSVEILPAQNGEINLQGYFSQYHLLLPKWSLREDDPEFLDRLRSSLKTYVEIIFKQAVHLGYSNIALFLENIHDELCSFPLDLVAKTIYEQLFEGLDSDVGAASARQELDVYICDYDHESVFNAFKYYIKKFGCEFGPPSQEKWDQISLKDTSKYVEYSSNMVEIKSTSPLRALENILFCYPILPTLEPFTSPIVNQADVSHDYLKREIQNFEDCNPDGIPEDGYFPLSYWPYKDVIIYCCPDWGPKADKAIYRSLKVCLYVATNKSAVYIVPPGMERTSKYPAKYLAQAMFKALDKLYNKISKRLKIFFVVDKKEYEKAFNDELKKRTPLTAKSYMQRFSSSFQSKLKGQMPLMEQTPVVFVSLSTSKISNGCHTFQAKLNELMSSNKFKIELIGDEINSFEVIFF